MAKSKPKKVHQFRVTFTPQNQLKGRYRGVAKSKAAAIKSTTVLHREKIRRLGVKAYKVKVTKFKTLRAPKGSIKFRKRK